MLVLLLSLIPPNALPLLLAPLRCRGRSELAHEHVTGKGGQGRQGWGCLCWDEDSGLGRWERFISLEDSTEVREVGG